MRKDDDRCAFGKRRQILLQPVELRRPEHAEAAFLHVRDIHESDEMNAAVIETEPPGALRAFAETLEVLRAIVAQDVMLAGNVEDLLRLACFQHLLEVIEFFGLGKMGEIAGVQDEVGLPGLRIDLRDRFPKGARDIRICRFREADMAVTDLREGEISGGGRRGCRGRREQTRTEDAAAHGPQNAGARPGHAFEEAPPVDGIFGMILRDEVGHNESSW